MHCARFAVLQDTLKKPHRNLFVWKARGLSDLGLLSLYKRSEAVRWAHSVTRQGSCLELFLKRGPLQVCLCLRLSLAAR